MMSMNETSMGINRVHFRGEILCQKRFCIRFSFTRGWGLYMSFLVPRVGLLERNVSYKTEMIKFFLIL